MKQDLRPIETTWKGYRFRSRLEARWAVFFENLRLNWSYEHEGFELESGLYLPDFFLKDGAGCFVEIKPNVSVSRAQKICAELSRVSDTPVLLIQGDPWPGLYWGMLFCEGVSYSDVRFGQTSRHHQPSIWLHSAEVIHCLKTGVDAGIYPSSEVDSPLVLEALLAARGARFEHGETPKPINQIKTL